MSATLIKQLSEQLAKAAEKSDYLAAQLSYTEGQLAQTQAQLNHSNSQLQEHQQGQAVRNAGNHLDSRTSMNRYSLASNLNTKKTTEPGPTTTTPDCN